jgi:WD40 repeat protein
MCWSEYDDCDAAVCDDAVITTEFQFMIYCVLFYFIELCFSLYSAAVDVPPLLFFTGSRDKTVRIWDVASHQQLAELRGHSSEVTSVAFDGSGKFLASGDVAEA